MLHVSLVTLRTEESLLHIGTVMRAKVLRTDR